MVAGARAPCAGPEPSTISEKACSVRGERGRGVVRAHDATPAQSRRRSRGEQSALDDRPIRISSDARTCAYVERRQADGR